MIPEKIKQGDTVRIIAPARGIMPWMNDLVSIAEKRLLDLGLKVTYGKHIKNLDKFNSTTVENRIEDLHKAFLDKEVKLILTVIGGYNSNQLLRYIDWDIIKNNPKVVCGYSDITALSNAIYTKTGIITYSGPHFFNFGEVKGFDYTLDYFKKCLFINNPYELASPESWSDDKWANDQENRHFIKSEDYYSIHEGEAEGIILGGNLCTFNLLQGTEYFPSLDGTILFIEDDEETTPPTFDRDLQSLIHQEGFNKVRALVFGRFQSASHMSKETLLEIIKTKKELKNIPIIADVDFGHTCPRITFPIGGTAYLNTSSKKITILKH